MNIHTDPSVIWLAINLESAADRRERLLQQARAAGIDLHLVRAYAGKDLSDEDKAGYDRARRLQEFDRDLTPNEIGCVLSHLKALREFVETGAPYAVIMEDDAVFSPRMKEGIDYIVHRTAGWQVLKLFSERGGEVTDITPSSAPADAPVRFIFPKKIYWVAVAILYTREAAEWVLEHCRTYRMAWDAQLSHLLLEHGIPYCAVDPDLIETFDPNNVASTIGKRDGQKAPFRLMRYLRRRLGVIRASRRKKAMRRYMQKHLTAK